MAKKKVWVIGEKINATANKRIEEAVKNKEAAFIENLALEQIVQGADILDICAGKKKDMIWLVKTVQEICALPLCFDSPNPEVIAAGLEAYYFSGIPFINSVNLEEEKIEEISALAEKYKAKVIALATLGKMEPEEARKDIAKTLVASLLEKGLKRQDIYLDPGVYPVAVDQNQAQIVINLIRFAKKELKIKTICSLSGVSHGLIKNKRRLLNKVFWEMLKGAQIDAVIANPAHLKLEINEEDFRVCEELLEGNDKWCRKFLRHFRTGRN